MKTFAIITLFLITPFLSCTKEIPEPPATEPIDITGVFNGYGYRDFNGAVPLEIIEIRKTGPDEYTATKTLGDNAVPTGMVTWKGNYKGTSPFPAKITGSPNGYTFAQFDCQVYVDSKDVLKIPNFDFGIVYIRRIDGYQP